MLIFKLGRGFTNKSSFAQLTRVDICGMISNNSNKDEFIKQWEKWTKEVRQYKITTIYYFSFINFATKLIILQNDKKKYN